MFADLYTEFVFVDIMKKFVLSLGMPKKLRQHKAKEFLSVQLKIYFSDAGILQEKTIPETP